MPLMEVLGYLVCAVVGFLITTFGMIGWRIEVNRFFKTEIDKPGDTSGVVFAYVFAHTGIKVCPVHGEKG